MFFLCPNLFYNATENENLSKYATHLPLSRSNDACPFLKVVGKTSAHHTAIW